MKILYVEDNSRDADLARRHLRKAAPHFRLDTVSTFSEAIRKLEGVDAEAPDLVLTDVRLPDGDGLSLLTYIRDRGLPLAVVVITGVGDEERAVAALKAGADDYVVKRGDYLDFLSLTLESALRRSRARAYRLSRPLRVLYAEHDPADVDLTRLHLARHAPHIYLDVVSTGLEALERANGHDEHDGQGDYDVLLLDYDLPGLNGLEVLKQMRQGRGLDTPVLLVSSHGDDDVAAHAIKLGASSYLAKNPGYLYRLASDIETAFYQADLARKQAALSQSESRYALATSAAGVGVWDWNLETNDVHVDPTLKMILGFRDDEVRDHMDDWGPLVHPDDRDAIQAMARAHIEGRDPYFEVEHRMLHKDGSVRWFLARGSAVRTEAGTAVRLVGTAVDITERKRSEERLRHYFELPLIGMAITSPDRRFVEVNQKLCDMLGYSIDELTGMSWIEVTHPEDIAENVRLLEQTLRRETEGYSMDKRFIHCEGRIVYASISACCVRRGDGTVDHLVLVVQDITERTQAEEALRQSEERFRQLAENIGVLFYMSEGFSDTSPGKILYVSPAYEEIWGRSRDTLYRDARAWVEAIHPDDRERIEAVLPGMARAEFDEEFRILRPNGEVRWVHDRVFPVYDERGELYRNAGIVEDVTRRKQTDEALRESEERLRLALEAGQMGAWDWDKRTNTLKWSRNHFIIMGLVPFSGDPTYDTWADRVHPDDHPRIMAALEKAIQENAEYWAEYRIVWPDGTIRWVESRGMPVYDDDRQCIGMRGVIVDVTERMRSEEALRESEQRYRSVVENQTELICRYLPDTTLTFVNEAYCRYFAKTRDHLIGTRFLDLIPESAREAVRKHIESLIENPRVEVGEHEVLLPDGSIGWQQWVDYGIHDSEGNLVEFQAIGRDITERKLAEKAILQRDQLLDATFNSISSEVVVVDRDGVITHASKSWEQFDHTRRSTLSSVGIGANYLAVCRRAANENDATAREALLGIEGVIWGTIPSFSMEYPFDAPTQRVWLLMHVDPMPPEHGGVVISHTDITQRKRTEESLQEALAQVQQLKDQLHAENIYLQEAIMVAHNFGEIIGRSQALKKVLRQAEQVAPLDTTVLVLGETGTGKELLAHAIHNLSPRKSRPLVKVNCATLPSHLIESELFGHEKGAFTGAHARRAGRFEIANGGTIFLDEIGELPLDLQAKLLRVLQEGQFERLGSSRTIEVDVRIIAATNRDLEEAVSKGAFRSDLYYRLSIFPITTPPLRERKEDIPVLVMHFVKQLHTKLGKEIESIPQETMEALQNYSWPGNVRELRNVIERAAIITQGTKLRLLDSLESRPMSQEASQPAATRRNFVETLEESQRSLIIQTLEKTYWRVEGPNGAAALLGVHPNTLRSRLKKLGITRPKFKSNSAENPG